MSSLKANLDFFKTFCPALDSFLEGGRSEGSKIIASRKGKPTATVNGHFVQSRYDPEGEVIHLASRHPRAIHLHIGLGLGYALLADRVAPDTRVLIFEPDASVLLMAFEVNPIFQWVQQKKASLFLDIESFLGALQGRAELLDDMNIYICPYHKKHWAEVVTQVLEKTKDLIANLAFQRQTYLNRADQVLASTIQSLPWSLHAEPFQALIKRFQGVPAVIAASGPSLEKNIADLIPIRKKILLFSISRSVKTLKRFGLEPDFLVHIEFQDFFQFIENSNNLSQTVFLLPFQCHSRYFMYPAGQHLVYESAHNMVIDWLTDQLPQIQQDPISSGGSVANDAFSLALAMGANPVILLGQDLAVDERTFLRQAGNIDAAKRDLRSVKGFFGADVKSPGNYRNFLFWLEENAKNVKRAKPDTRLINCTEGGAAIDGFEQRSLRDVTHSILNDQPDISFPDVISKGASAMHKAGDALMQLLNSALNTVQEIQHVNKSMLTTLDKGAEAGQELTAVQIEKLLGEDRVFQDLCLKIPFYADFFQKDLHHARDLLKCEMSLDQTVERFRVLHQGSMRASQKVITLIQEALQALEAQRNQDFTANQEDGFCA